MTDHDPAVESAVRSAWVKAYGLASWKQNRAFDEEGSNSLKILEVILDIEDALEVPIPANIVSVEMTARDLIGAISRLLYDASAAKVPDDRPLVFLFADGMSGEDQAALRDELAGWFRFAMIDANRGAALAAEQMLQSDPHGAINVIACGSAAAPAMDAAGQLIRKGYQRGFEFVLDPASDAQSMRTRIVDAFIASRHGAG